MVYLEGLITRYARAHYKEILQHVGLLYSLAGVSSSP